MAFVCLIIDDPGNTITQLNSKLKISNGGSNNDAMVLLRNYLDAIGGGLVDASVEVTSRDTNPSVATSGSGSAQQTFNLK